MSIFERFGYAEDDGSPIELQSHSLRHYLNMLAQTGGLSSTEIALFSGRKDVKQNRAYDHMTSDEVQAPISQALNDGFTSELEPLFGVRRDLIARGEFKGLGLTAVHTTEYGWCSHDFASEPCQIYRDCINCEEQECIKGETQKEANLRMLKSETEYLLKKAQEALGEEEYGADTWSSISRQPSQESMPFWRFWRTQPYPLQREFVWTWVTFRSSLPKILTLARRPKLCDERR
jgi:hypothetical protein